MLTFNYNGLKFTRLISLSDCIAHQDFPKVRKEFFKLDSTLSISELYNILHDSPDEQGFKDYLAEWLYDKFRMELADIAVSLKSLTAPRDTHFFRLFNVTINFTLSGLEEFMEDLKEV